ncbi:PREDICTED: uncharacterized protein LOC109590392 [Amphimedon queenslandica]|uniref:Uncharacterized protein n=1 Tax=Amphimedon queenslandica TaxID=400682 RepID=A0AAN0JY75_AMPQE|nr:PREDICTED: uncharacterized protein LOC109590392 [Amphimedon queenslandica]|eukprot:XP_019861877.1 PREDICTED: uncharacterized protein LOC109590392 [Amphimedon queenslandica]
MYEVDLLKSDAYGDVVSKISEVLDVDDTDCVLLSLRGCIIKDETIETGSRSQKWTLGAYLAKRHIAPDKLTLGIGSDIFIQERKKQKRDDGSKEQNLVSDKVGKSYLKDQFNDVQIFDDNSCEESSDAYEVLYCFEEDSIALTQYEVWLKDNGHPEKMDCFGAFNPSSDFTVFKVIRKRDHLILYEPNNSRRE